MNEEYRQKLTEFLKDYLEVKGKGFVDGIMTEKAIIQGLKLLVDEGVYTKKELTKLLIKKYGILVS